MSSLDLPLVRSTIASYFDGLITAGNLPGVASFSPAPLTIDSAGDFVTGNTNDCGAWLYFPDGNTQLISIGGPTAGVFCYQLHTTIILGAVSTDGDALDAQNQIDQAMSSITAAIITDRNAGNADVIFQWGFGDAGGSQPDITWNMELPWAPNLAAVWVFGTINFSTLAVKQLQ